MTDLTKSHGPRLVISVPRTRLSCWTILATAVSAFLLVFSLSGVVVQQGPAAQAASRTGGDVAMELSQGSGQATAQLTARVVAITDGDTLTVLSPQKKRMTVRLMEIDAPESGQPWGARAKDALSELTLGHEVEIRAAGKDQYGRVLGRVYRSGTDVNAEMIHAGDAWAYRDYLTDTSFLEMEAEARAAKRGLWALPANQVVPPWIWRHGELSPPSIFTSSRSAPITSLSDSRCAGKRYCREMTSCAEARFYLSVCHVDSLDGDDDGVPCENICTR